MLPGSLHLRDSSIFILSYPAHRNQTNFILSSPEIQRGAPGGLKLQEPQNHLGGLLAQVVLGPTPGFLTQQFRHGARVRIPNELPGDAVTAALGPTAGRAAGPHHHRWSKG